MKHCGRLADACWSLEPGEQWEIRAYVWTEPECLVVFQARGEGPRAFLRVPGVGRLFTREAVDAALAKAKKAIAACNYYEVRGMLEDAYGVQAATEMCALATSAERFLGWGNLVADYGTPAPWQAADPETGEVFEEIA